MRAFLRTLLAFAVLPAAVFAWSLWRADGETDEYYLRFTTPPAGSMILGTSRSAQGLRPQVMDSVLGKSGHPGQVLNYSFALGISNYGPAYLRSIGRKLDPSARDGVFVLAVDPWSLGARAGESDATGWPEDERFLAKLRLVSMKPNVEYLLTAYQKPILTIAWPRAERQQRTMRVHPDGWLEVRLPMDSASVAKRERDKLREYRATHAPGLRVSEERIAWLERTITLVRPHGRVLLVRMPVGAGMLALEDSLAPGFSARMEAVAREQGARFLDLTLHPGPWRFTDGHHLEPGSAAEASRLVAEALTE